MYDYFESVKEDVKLWMEENKDDILEWINNGEDIEEKIYEECFCNDNVTGNASGSYTCNAYEAEEYISHNWDLLSEALKCFDCDVNFLKNGPEWCDVTIRCYLLNQVISDIIENREIEWLSEKLDS